MKNTDIAIAYIVRILGLVKAILLKIWSFSRIDRLYRKFIGLKRKHKIIAMILAIGLMIGYKSLFSTGYQPDVKVVEIYKVSTGNLLSTTRLLGTIKAKKYFTANAGYSGTVAYIAESGTKLKTGEKIAQIDKPEVEDSYKSALESLKIATSQYDRVLHLAKTNAASKQTVEDKYTAMAKAQSSLAIAKQELDKMLFTAPFDGVVGSPLYHAGSKVSEGSTIVVFYNPSELVVTFDIPSNLLGEIGEKATVTLNGQDYVTAPVQRALAAGSYTVPAYIDFKCANCIIGEITNLDLHLIEKQNIITVPASCVFISNGQLMVYKVKGTELEIQPVKTGMREKDTLEILEGVKIGDILVLQGQSRLYPGVPVKIYEGE